MSDETMESLLRGAGECAQNARMEVCGAQDAGLCLIAGSIPPLRERFPGLLRPRLREYRHDTEITIGMFWVPEIKFWQTQK